MSNSKQSAVKWYEVCHYASTTVTVITDIRRLTKIPNESF